MEKVKELKQLYDLFLSVPGMNEAVKIDLTITRKNALLLAQVIQKGLLKEEGGNEELLGVISKESQEELGTIAAEFLQKAGLVELNEKLRQL